MVKNRNLLVWFGRLNLVGGILALPLIYAFSQTSWGSPGTSAYQTYELLNRLMAVCLLMMSAGWLGAFWSWPGGYGRWAAQLAFIGSLILVAGIAAEFWLFTSHPYDETASLRNAAWSAFGVGGWMLIIGAMVLGVAAWRSRTWPRWSAILLMLALPLDVIAFFWLDSLFLTTTILALVVGLNLVITKQLPAPIETAVS